MQVAFSYFLDLESQLDLKVKELGEVRRKAEAEIQENEDKIRQMSNEISAREGELHKAEMELEGRKRKFEFQLDIAKQKLQHQKSAIQVRVTIGMKPPTFWMCTDQTKSFEQTQFSEPFSESNSF